MKTGYICTNYFRGIDGLGNCDTECQWWTGSCPAAKGSKEWDGLEHYTERQPIKQHPGDPRERAPDA